MSIPRWVIVGVAVPLVVAIISALSSIFKPNPSNPSNLSNPSSDPSKAQISSCPDIKVNGELFVPKLNLEVGEEMSVSVNASSPNRQPLKYNWSAENGNIARDLKSTSSATYKALKLEYDTIYVVIESPNCSAPLLARKIYVSESTKQSSPASTYPVTPYPGSSPEVLTPQPSPVEFVTTYFQLVKEHKYAESYNMLSQSYKSNASRAETLENYGKFWDECNWYYTDIWLKKESSKNPVVSLHLSRKCPHPPNPYNVVLEPNGTNNGWAIAYTYWGD